MTTKQAPTKSDALKRTEIALIKMGQAALGLDDGTYRDMLATLCDGKTSCTALTWQEREKVITHMKASGFVVKKTAASSRAWDDGMSKLRAIWYALAEVQAVRKPGSVQELDAAIESWARRMQPKLQALRFASGWQMQQLIEAAKKWAVRVGAPTEQDQTEAAKARQG